MNLKGRKIHNSITHNGTFMRKEKERKIEIIFHRKKNVVYKNSHTYIHTLYKKKNKIKFDKSLEGEQRRMRDEIISRSLR